MPTTVFVRCTCGTTAMCKLHQFFSGGLTDEQKVIYKDLAEEEKELANLGMADYAKMIAAFEECPDPYADAPMPDYLL